MRRSLVSNAARHLQEQRREEFVSSKRQIILLMEELDHTPDTSFERDVVCEDEEAFCLSTDNIAALQNLLQQVRWHAEAALLAVEAVDGSWQQLASRRKERLLGFQQACVLKTSFRELLQGDLGRRASGFARCSRANGLLVPFGARLRWR